MNKLEDIASTWVEVGKVILTGKLDEAEHALYEARGRGGKLLEAMNNDTRQV